MNPILEEKTCRYCSSTFQGMQGKTFSNHVRWCNSNPKNARAEIDCPFCNKPVWSQASTHHQQSCPLNPENIKNCEWCGKAIELKGNKFCTRACAAHYNNKHFPRKTGPKEGYIPIKIEKVCPGCLKPFIVFQHSQKKKCDQCFMSEPLKPCIVCGKIVIRKSYNNRKTCSDDCYRARLSESSRTNENCGGETNYRRFLYKGILMDSSWEVQLAEYMDAHSISWERSRKHMLHWTDDEGKQRRYYPDFWLPGLKCYVDTKNKFLMKQDSIKLFRVVEENKITLFAGGLDEVIRSLELRSERSTAELQPQIVW